MAKKDLECSFCGRKKSETNLLIAGLDAHICDRCIEQAHGIVLEETKTEKTGSIKENLDISKPKAIKDFLDQYIIGQDHTKKVMSVAVYNHYKRLLQPASKDDIEIQKSNVVLVGKTGTGKTLMAKTIAQMLNVPIAIVDATILTEAGYVGEDVETILTKLLAAADYDKEKAEQGIIFIDEIDKIARKSDKHPDQKFIEINTENILFIAGGAFDGIERVISKRLNMQAVGYGASKSKQNITDDKTLQYIIPKDVKDFGLIPEIVGRMPVLSYMDPLDKATLKQILTEPKNAIIKQYEKLFQMDDIKFEITSGALDFIVDKALEYKLGARGLRSICETILTDAMFNMPDSGEKNLKVTKSYAVKALDKSSFNPLKAAS